MTQTTKWVAAEVGIWLMRSTLVAGASAVVTAPFVGPQHGVLLMIPMLVLLVLALAAEAWSITNAN